MGRCLFCVEWCRDTIRHADADGRYECNVLYDSIFRFDVSFVSFDTSLCMQYWPKV